MDMAATTYNFSKINSNTYEVRLSTSGRWASVAQESSNRWTAATIDGSAVAAGTSRKAATFALDNIVEAD